MGEMADFVLEDLENEIYDYYDHIDSDPVTRYDHGHIDELGYEEETPGVPY